ncbi:hypothetical protein ACFFH4_03530 [Halalkalibacter alkalisediminis]|uniref:Uncharacterized protein n=2 Tax=Halalkalibacter alkalisediminis TaxID=935616 RepID=A0ABV6NBF4_9BACI
MSDKMKLLMKDMERKTTTMFSGNKLVLILPGILMVVMLIGGYQFLQGSEEVTNEQLQELVDSQVNIIEVESGLQVEVAWDLDYDAS